MPLMFPLIAFIILMLVGRHLGRRFALSFAILMAFLSFITCLYYFIQVFFNGLTYSFTIANWVLIGSFDIPYKFLIDPLSITFATLIAFITLLILIYSYDYLYYDPNLVKFFAYLSLFAFSMSCLVLAGNYFVMFLGWEAVGLASYCLINFWTTRNQANQSAIKAIIFNRIGDAAFICAMALIFYVFNTLDLDELRLLTASYQPSTIQIFSFSFSTIEVIAASLFLAAAAKSAQLFLHPWLPDAMEGPTPVSALLHSATMVTAGIFLVLRSNVIFSQAETVSYFTACIGLITANISSFTGLLQYDIKRIIAFSTCSQLGFMMFAVGIGNFSFALFHLVNHAFFKALLFLCAGSVIHATGHQDIRKMGGLYKLLPITYTTMLIASLSLIGYPFLSGFYSKDFLLETTFNQFESFSFLIYFISALSTAISSFYSFRLIYFVFFGEPSITNQKAATESSPFLYSPLLILAIFSICSGLYLKDIIVIHSSMLGFNPLSFDEFSLDQDFFHDLYKALPTIFSLLGLSAVIIIYSFFFVQSQVIYKRYILLPYLFCKKFFADAINSYFIYLPSARFSLNTSYKLIDQGVLEIATSGYNLLEKSVSSLASIETSVLYRSFLFLIFAIGASISYFFNLPILFLASLFIASLNILKINI